MDTYPVYLWPKGALASAVNSDTLFGAVCWAIRILNLTDVEKLLADFDQHPRFAFSALWPVIQTQAEDGNAARIRFYPRPLLPPLSPVQIDALTKEEIKRQTNADHVTAKKDVIERAKRLKQKTLVSEQLFAEIVTGQTTMQGLFRRIKDCGSRAADVEPVGNALIGYAERRLVWQDGVLRPLSREEAVQHNQVDRVAGATAEGLLFFEQETHFRVGSGLWCVLRADAQAVRECVLPAFRYLQDTGLGANRTVGKGHFRIEVGEPFELPQADEADSFVALGHYLPRPNEWAADASPLHYELRNLWPKRESKFVHPTAGQRTAPIRKRRMRMFAPGSIFPLQTRQELYGQLAQAVLPEGEDHAVWQSGITVPVFARIATQQGGNV
ncbi:MAG: type III-A CRISPR-associated RAMP protein Csm4 [Anaerolineae bacterium]|nr:type III-A CRISPR-associated RAMP protein Csm4 [Anaerolineae bacterium]